MKTIEIVQIVLFFGLGILLTPVLGRFMARVFKGERTILHPVLGPVENFIYRLTGIDTAEEMTWLEYFVAVVMFAIVGAVGLFTMFMTQQWLPLNPANLPNLAWHLAFMQAWSFICNADWQSYSGESTMSYLSQVAGVMVHQFLSAAAGIAVMVAVGRALKRRTTRTIGSFWVDLTRCLLYLVLPLSILWAIPLAWQGVPQTFKPYQTVKLVEPYTTQVPKTDAAGQAVNGPDGKPVMVDQKVEEQTIPVGAVASFMSVKQLFTNGGGWFGVNSAHPFENPTPASNFLEMLAIIVVPMALVYLFGELIGDRRHAWTLFMVMLGLYLFSFGVAWHAESQPNPVVHNIQPYMEGKEVRIGVMNSILVGHLPRRLSTTVRSIRCTTAGCRSRA